MDEIIDHLATRFPLHFDRVSSLSQVLRDVLGSGSKSGEFFYIFIDTYGEAVLLEVNFVAPPIPVTIPGLGGFSLSIGQAGEIDIDVAVALDESNARFFLFDAPIIVECIKADWLTPVVRKGDKWEPDVNTDGSIKKASLVFSGLDIEADSDGNIEFKTDLKVDLQPVRIGKSGVVVEMRGLRVCMSDQAQLPDGVPAGSRGFAADNIDVYLPDSIKGSFAPNEIKGEGLFIGSGGFTGKLSAEWSDGKPLQLAGIECTLKSLMFDFKQNSLVESALICELNLPFFDQPVNLEVSFSGDGSLLASLSAVQPEGVNYDGGLIHFEKENVFKATIEGISFELKNGVSTLSVSGAIEPSFLAKGAQAKDEAPTFKIRELSIDSQGQVKFDGGWMELPEQYSLDFHGFHLGITKLGFGKTEDGGKWIGVSGELKLVDGFTAGASVEGLRVAWYDDGREPKISFNGIGVEFAIPDVLYFKGDVAYRELEVNGESVRRFDGDIKLSLISLKLEIDAKLVVGSASGPQGSYNFFAIYLGVELPTGIPISPTPLSLFGMAGLFALQMEPDKRADEEWYEGWFKRPEIGITDLESKWVNRRGSMAFGVGATIGTGSDNGFTFACKALLVIVFPGPIFLLEGKANLLKERAKLSDDPMFRSLAVLDMRQRQILIGLDAKYKQDETGKVIDITAGAEAFFGNPGDWHIYMGEQEPREKRIRARILNLFEANSYFMLDAKRLKTGAWVGYARSWKFGPVSLTLEAWLEGNVVVNWTPLHFYGDLWLHGNIEVNVFGFGLGLSVDARFAADVFDPFHVKASFEVSIKLPRPLKKKRFEITLEWGPRPDWPKLLPLPLKEVAIEHFKVTTSWPLPKNGIQPLLGPKYDWEKEGLRGDAAPPAFSEPPTSALPVVPLDCRPHISFGRPVHDDALVGINPQPVQPEYERIGDPERNEGPVRVRYSLKQIELCKWDAQAQQWPAIAVAGRPLNSGERKLYGSWAPVPQLPSGTAQTGGAAVANVKLWLWSKTPFDYTRHSGSETDDWFETNFPEYPCVPQEIPDREVCCDFERLDRSQFLDTPWRSPEHPEITLTWQSRARQRVTVLNPPVEGLTRALCFRVGEIIRTITPQPIPGSRETGLPVSREAAARLAPSQPSRLAPSQPVLVAPAIEPGGTVQTFPNSLMINLSAPAKRVKLLIVEGKKPDKVCLNFRNRQRGDVKLPFNEQGVTIASGSATTTNILLAPTTLGDMFGLNCSIPVPGTPPGIVNITLPCAATTVELMLSFLPSPIGSTPPTIQAFNAKGEQVAAKTMLNPLRQPEIVRFEGSDLKQIRISPPRSVVVLHELCFMCLDTAPAVTATGFDKEGRPTRSFANEGNVVEVSGENLTQVQLGGKGEICLLKICALFGPDPQEVARRAEMKAHLESEVERWQQAGEVLEPDTIYRLRILTNIKAHGEGQLSGVKNLTQEEFAYFRTGGPPGLTTLSLPTGRDAAEADKFDSGLDDLTRYVRQTTPATVPATGEKPSMAKPVYRAYDVGVEFNEDYVDQMYRMSGRQLGLYLFDNNNLPVRDAEGHLLVESGDWAAAGELTLTEGERRWLALSNASHHCLPLIEETSIVRDQQLTSAIAGRVLKPNMIYEARLIPLGLGEVLTDNPQQTVPVAYRFQFTTSLFANFFHHLHSYQDETWRVAVEGVAGVAQPAIAQAVKPSVLPAEAESRAYETLATAVLGTAARQNPPEVQVSRVEIDGAQLAFLVQSPEPIDWQRTEISLSRTGYARTETSLPGKVKLAAVNFGANRTDLDSVELLLREPLNMTGYRIETRLVTWPFNRGRIVVLNTEALPNAGFAEPVWETYHTFGAEQTSPAGTTRQVLPVNTTSVSPLAQAFFSIEARIVAPDGNVVHARHFLPDDNYVSEDVNVLRKADGTGFFLIKLDANRSGIPFSLGQYRLKLTYRRDNRTLAPASRILSEAGNQADEVVTVDIPSQTVSVIE